MKSITVHVGRTSIVPVSVGYDISQDTITSEIRELVDPSSPLIATWNVEFLTDGVDGELILTLDDSETLGVDRPYGFMDLKRLSGGEPLSIFGEPLQVLFASRVTA